MEGLPVAAANLISTTLEDKVTKARFSESYRPPQAKSFVRMHDASLTSSTYKPIDAPQLDLAYGLSTRDTKENVQ